MDQSKRIYLSPPHMGGHELVYVNDAFQSNWISTAGPHIGAFENELAEYLGAKACLATGSGTSALHLALIVLGVGRGDEVLCPTLTFAASANPIVYQGALPVFVDSEDTTWNISADYLELAIKARVKRGRKPKAAIVVDLYGMPADYGRILALLERYEIPLIEDAAEALGSRYNVRALGTLGSCGMISFNGNKIITTSGGGALISDNPELISRARHLSTQAREPAAHYEHKDIGYNYRMSNILAAIGRGQLEVLHRWIDRKRSNFEFYKQALSGLNGFSFLDEPAGCFSNRWLTTILIDPLRSAGLDRERLRKILEEHNIESRPVWKPMHLQPVYQDAPYYGAQTAQSLFTNGLCLPSGSDLESSQLEGICALICNAAKR